MDWEKLSDAPLFRNLNRQDAEAVLSGIPYKVKRYPEGSLIAQTGDTVSSLMIVLSGKVKGEMIDEAGRVIKIEDIPAPGALAAAFLFGSNNRFPVNVSALADSEIFFVDRADFLRMLMRNDTFLVNYLNMISNRTQFLTGKIKFLNFKTIKGKLAHLILQMAGNGESSVNLEMTQSEMADFFGVARPSISRAIGELEEEGLIVASGRKISIADRKGLADLTLD